MTYRRALALSCLLLSAPAAFAASSGASDPNLWLEAWSGPRVTSWIETENAKTSAVLEADPRFSTAYADALAVAEAKDRIPIPEFLRGDIYNFWQDGGHVRGVWRRTTLADYGAAEPAWRTVLDLDALSAAEGANWVFKGVECEWRLERRCLVSLSDGGEDAVTVREFDLDAAAFAPGGFALPKGKQRVAWVDPETLLVAREWAPGDLTASGYPYIVKLVKRGEPLASAREVYRGGADDAVGVSLETLHDGQGRSATLLVRSKTFFENETWILEDGGVSRLALPAKSRVRALVDGRLVVSLDEDWITSGRRFSQGSLVALDLQAARATPGALTPTLIRAPGPRESIEGVAATKTGLYVVVYENVKARAYRFTPGASGAWSPVRLALPDNSAIEPVAADAKSERVFLRVNGFIDPTTLWLADGAAGSLRSVKSVSPKFDAGNLTVDQFEAASTDGKPIPYFVVHAKTLALNGANPTIMTAYGGFQLSRYPAYDPILGKLWLERGGVFVLANIRGGGEFGPAWHEAGLKTKRQKIYDDFAAVARDLIARRITSPRRLGIQGGSNGGLLVGVEMTQHPELFHAVDIERPLLDMLRFEQIAAGASWVGEYGSVTNPAERAFLASISPYNNLRAGVTYPEPFIFTTTKDDRVGPQHARKFAARMGQLGQPYLFYELREGGHGTGANLKEQAHTQAMEYVYMYRKLID